MRRMTGLAYHLLLAAGISLSASADYCVKASWAAVRTGETLSFRVEVNPSSVPEAAATYAWSCSVGALDAKGDHAVYHAPETPGWAVITVTSTPAGGVQTARYAAVFVYRQFVMLKADDLAYGIDTSWTRFIQTLESRGIKGSIGIVAKGLESMSERQITQIRAVHDRGFIEFWNHGYDHCFGDVSHKGLDFFLFLNHDTNYVLNDSESKLSSTNPPWGCHAPDPGTNSDDDSTVPPPIPEPPDDLPPAEGAWWEFSGTSYDFQRVHFQEAQRLAMDRLGFPFETFGAPHNKVDASTVQALREMPGIKVWLFGLPCPALMTLERVGNIEESTGRPDLAFFLSSYDAKRTYLVLQMHPALFLKNNAWSGFEDVLSFLQERGCTFIKPIEYYALVREGKLPLSPADDSDQDGRSDSAEGQGDADGDGLPDFLDAGQ